MTGRAQSDAHRNDDDPQTGVREWVVCHWGARDRYRVAASLNESGLLRMLVTDLYVPSPTIGRHPALPARLRRLSNRHHVGLPSSKVDSWAILATPFRYRRTALGQRAARLANRTNSGLIVYSANAGPAARWIAHGRPLVVFQEHPLAHQALKELAKIRDPRRPREEEELWDDNRHEDENRYLRRADHFIVTTNFTKTGLMAAGVDGARISVVPYGVTSDVPGHLVGTYRPADVHRIGYLGQPLARKGFLALVEALRVSGFSGELHLIGRAASAADVDPEGLGCRIVRTGELSTINLFAYLASTIDTLVAPSLVEGYGLAIHEALASGANVITTPNTMASDLPTSAAVTLVEPADVDDLAEAIGRLERVATPTLSSRNAARALVAEATWDRFGSKIRSCLGEVASY